VAKKYYVVWEGRERGIFTDWDTCKRQVDQFAGARYKSYKTRQEAEIAFRSSAAAAFKKAKATPKPKRSSASGPKTYSVDEIASLDVSTKIFADGGCDPNPGKAASGVAVYRDGAVADLWYGLFNPAGTNNTAELNALHQSLLLAQREIAEQQSVAIFCDSKYAIQCITQWAFNWQKKGWKKQGGDIKNLEMIQDIFALYVKLRGSVQVLHVNGHVGVEGNELADRMSMHGIEEKEEQFVQFKEHMDVQAVLAMRKG